MKRIIQTFLLVSMVFLLMAQSGSNNSSKETSLHFGLGVYHTPAYKADDVVGLEFMLKAQFHLKKTLALVRIGYGYELAGFYDPIFGNTNPKDRNLELSFLLGHNINSTTRQFRGRTIDHSFMAFAGLGFASGNYRGDLIKCDNSWFPDCEYEQINFSVLSLPLELQYLRRKKDGLAFGVSLFGNLNFARPSYGMVLTLGG
ncbi:MAG: hypothetical protein JXR19_09435 [Bacteroidia bacterium]